MSKFHKTLGAQFTSNETYIIKGKCYSPQIKNRSDNDDLTYLQSVNILNPVEVIYIGFEKGHLKFRQTSDKNLPEIISVYGSYIRDNKVCISKNGLTFTANGWI